MSKYFSGFGFTSTRKQTLGRVCCLLFILCVSYLLWDVNVRNQRAKVTAEMRIMELLPGSAFEQFLVSDPENVELSSEIIPSFKSGQICVRVWIEPKVPGGCCDVYVNNDGSKVLGVEIP